jgi:hypothetical protein
LLDAANHHRLSISLLPGSEKLFAEHFCYDENENGSAKASAQEKIKQRISDGGE